VALKQGRLDDAAARYTRMEEIYRAVHGDRHYLIAIARSNLASVAMERKEYARAEAIYRDVVARFTAAQSADHLNTGIARVKLGRSLVRQHRHAEAERELLTGYEILVKQTKAPVSWLAAARTDLVEVYTSLGQPEKAARYRAELTGAGGP
jgi:serine/threonine-protein kinase